MIKEKAPQLPDELIVALYKNVLIDPSSFGKKEQEVHQYEPKEILILVKSDSAVLNEKQTTFLSAILKALKLEMSNINLICNGSNDFGPYQELTKHLIPNKIILFGISPAEISLPMHFPLFQIQSFEKIKYLCAPTLEEIESEKSLKMTLWQTLQQLFI
jgi:DNA polymerase III psi subunit